MSVVNNMNEQHRQQQSMKERADLISKKMLHENQIHKEKMQKVQMYIEKYEKANVAQVLLSLKHDIRPIEVSVTVRRESKRASKLPARVSRVLKAWLYENMDDPYPSEYQKNALRLQTGLTKAQINNWFSNARRRTLKYNKEKKN